MSALFFHALLPAAGEVFTPEPDALKHITRVLRMKAGDKLRFTNGSGLIAQAEIATSDKHTASIRVLAIETVREPERRIRIAISLLKNDSRFEWFLEKAAELGVHEIVPLICSRTERGRFRKERAEGILRSAMLQSQQARMTSISEPVDYLVFLSAAGGPALRLIAHCESGEKQDIQIVLQGKQVADTICVLIGPEGDFTSPEIDSAIAASYVPITLGNNRLRTETAALKAAVILTGLI